MVNWWKHMDHLVEVEEGKKLEGPQVIHKLQEYTENDAILSVDVGNVTTWMARFFSNAESTICHFELVSNNGLWLTWSDRSKINPPR